ncbi:hypothetical protein [Flavobacterium psychrophilum]|uniref:hypothetical protein n=1 Tax=Flavobacterium psychrophilum TaxID=96345 RepID=UPI0010690258|nr:hypothetical protein [Flavobacterium psychrophilum]
MAKQKGHIKYVGTLGEVRHFKIKGNEGYFAGLKGGPTAEQVKTAPGFIRTRENMSEFAACANAGKSVRIGLSALMKQMTDSQFTGRLTAIMKKINIEDGSEARGQRAVLVSQQPQYLKGLDFNRNISFNGIFSAPFTLTANADRNESTLSVPAFNPLNFLNIPSGATHFRIINALSVISDFVFNPATGAYEPAEPMLNETSNISYSPYTPVDAVTTLIDVVATLPDAPTITTNVAVLGSIGIEFYQQVGVNYYLFNAGNAMKIQEVF